jgi:hypothetical protein
VRILTRGEAISMLLVIGLGIVAIATPEFVTGDREN